MARVLGMSVLAARPLLAGGVSEVVSLLRPCMRPFASTSASRAVRKRKQKLRMRHWQTPERLLRQRDGDFPVQLRPAGLIPDTRDLQDSSLDAEADAEGETFRRAPIPKPHKVREALSRRDDDGGRRERATMGGSIATVAALRSRRTGSGPDVAVFDPERDMDEEQAAALSAMRARALAKRNYKWMPNPFGKKPGDLGVGPEAEAKYYERYFDGRRPAQDQRARGTGSATGEELRDSRGERPRRERISPKRFWIQPEYVTPDPPSVAMMSSRELKFAMVNEAHAVRKWRNGHPDGRAAGLPPGSERLWRAFGLRAAELAHVAGARPPRADDLVAPGDAVGFAAQASCPAEGDDRPEAGRRPPQRCSLSTTLRFLQAMASVQAGPFSSIQQLMSRVLESLRDLRPHQCFFLLQAMSRLRIKHPKGPQILQRMSLAWRMLAHKKLVKAANAVAKLDLSDHLWAKPLKLALVKTLPQLSGKHLTNLKFITVAELLGEPEGLRSYLTQAEVWRSRIRYSRHLQMVELHVHLVHPDVWQSLDEGVRLFLQEVRSTAEELRKVGNGDARGRRRGRAGSGSDSESESSEGEGDSDDESSSSSDSAADASRGAVPAATFEAALRSRRPAYDRSRFSSALHADVSRVLATSLGVDHHNRLAAGPLTVDMCHLPTMTVIEAAPMWQFYVRSPQMTALARRRQELLQAMGFRVVRIPYHRWESLQDDDEAKAAFLREQLPREMLPSLSSP